MLASESPNCSFSVHRVEFVCIQALSVTVVHESLPPVKRSLKSQDRQELPVVLPQGGENRNVVT